MTRVKYIQGETIIWPSVGGGVWIYYSNLDQLDFHSARWIPDLVEYFYNCGHSRLAEAILETVGENLH